MQQNTLAGSGEGATSLSNILQLLPHQTLSTLVSTLLDSFPSHLSVTQWPTSDLNGLLMALDGWISNPETSETVREQALQQIPDHEWSTIVASETFISVLGAAASFSASQFTSKLYAQQLLQEIHTALWTDVFPPPLPVSYDGETRLWSYHDLLDTKSFLERYHHYAAIGQETVAPKMDVIMALHLLQRVLKSLVAVENNTRILDIHETISDLYILSIAILTGSGDPKIRHKVSSDLLSLFFTYERQNPTSEERHLKKWCSCFWERVEALNALTFPGHMEKEGLELLREIPAVLCRIFDPLFGLAPPPALPTSTSATNTNSNKKSKSSTTKQKQASTLVFAGAEGMGMDIRREHTLWKMIQDGLLSGDGITSKYCMFLIKRIVDFSARYHTQLDSSSSPATCKPFSPLFKWSSGANREFNALWQEYFHLYETSNETVPHLFEPLMMKLPQLLHSRKTSSGDEVKLDVSWWKILIRIGTSNKLLTIRKRVLEHILTHEDPVMERVLAGEGEFVLKDVLVKLDMNALYVVPGLGNFVSPFGEKLREFIVRLVSAFEETEKKALFIQSTLFHISRFNNRLAAIYILLGLTDTIPHNHSSFQPLTPTDLVNIRSAFMGERYIAVWTRAESRVLLRQLCVGFLCAWTRKESVTFADILSTLSPVVGVEDDRLDSLISEERKVKERESVRMWLWSGGFKWSIAGGGSREGGEGRWLGEHVKEAVRGYLDNSEASLATEIQEAFKISLMASYLLPSSPLNIHNFVASGPSLFSQALEPLISRLARLHSGSTYAASGIVSRALFLLHHILRQVYSLLGSDVGALKIVWPDILNAQMVEDIISVSLQHLRVPEDRSTDRIDEIAGVLKVLCIGHEGGIAKRSAKSVVGLAKNVSSLKELFWGWATLSWQILEESVAMKAAAGSGILQTRKYASVQLLNTLYESATVFQFWDLPFTDEHCVHKLMELKMERTLETNEDRNTNWTEDQNTFQEAQYSCIRQLLTFLSQKSRMVSYPLTESLGLLAFESCTEALTTGSFTTSSFIMDVMALILRLPWTLTGPLIKRATEASLAQLEDNWYNARPFLVMIDSFTSMLFQGSVLGAESIGDEGTDAVREAALKFIEWSVNRNSIVPPLATKALQYWRLAADLNSPEQGRALKSMLRFKDVFIQFLVYGPSFEKEKDENKMDSVMSSKLKMPDLEKTLTAEDLEEMKHTAEMNFYLKDYTVRIRANDILTRLDPKRAAHREVGLAILKDLVDMHMDGLFYARFRETFEHRQQTRAWCSIQLLLVHITTENADYWADRLIDCLDADTLHTTRPYIEWAILRVLIAFPQTMPILWQKMSQYDRKAHAVTSLLVIPVHIGKHLPLSHKAAFYTGLFAAVNPWMTSNHFTIRVHAQLTIFNAWNDCIHPTASPELKQIASESAIKGAATFVTTNVDCARHREKAEMVYYLAGGFDPLEDLSIGFIFKDGLLCAGVTEEERISSWAFERIDSAPGRNIPVHYPAARRASRRIAPPDEVDIIEEKALAEEVNKDNSDEALFQRKVMPWEAMMQMDMDLSQGREEQVNKARNPLIVVASLVSKAPNLGGLCRTCEIFNAELLVVNDLKVKDDVKFLSTVVTADKWMPMHEVKEADLMAYLLKKKDEGYSLIGIEQATRSVSMENFTFPEKCLVILGKEKEGMPAEYMPILDHILEIPQFGVIRSLNVHVSGALTIWEYTRQMVTRRALQHG
ncbi:Tar (HIV-1) RNA binding protein 1 [Chytridiales sp. JEL 0842]|nr:Tar (HIV-1) RNA binding protein 1 [Chytridiales sp. JEL 0842]